MLFNQRVLGFWWKRSEDLLEFAGATSIRQQW